MRDDFPAKTIDTLAKRVQYRCSNPNCPLGSTIGPHTDPYKTVNIGVAAHITAASKRGPRYDRNLTPEERSSIENGIWLCQTCSRLIDRNVPKYGVELLRQWKRDAEHAASATLEGRAERPGPIVEPANPNRSAMIKKVRTIWISGFLEQSLFQQTRVILGLNERPDAVARPMDLLVRRPDERERPLPPGTQVMDVFDRMDRSLLILGAPGSGKSTLLLELARDLLDLAQRDPAHPIPVVFPLSTWAERRKPLVEWLQDELSLRYDVPRQIAGDWVKSDEVLPLLDGLDEVKLEHRAACVDAVNAFRQSHGLLPLVITSRMADYEALAAPLRFHGAIVVRSLTREQVNTYLADLGSHGETVRAAIREDSALSELLDTPLVLNVVSVAYAGQTEAPPPVSGTVAERRAYLFGSYVDQMLRRRAAERRYSPDQTVHWLSWLANQMAEHGHTVFQLEQLQLHWLPRCQRKKIPARNLLIVGLGFGLILGLVPILTGHLAVGLPLAGFIGFAVANVFLRPIEHGPHGDNDIYCAESISWSWSEFRPAATKTLAIGLVAGMVIGPLLEYLIPSVEGPFNKLLRGLAFGLFGALLMAPTFGAASALTYGEIVTRAVPNEGIRRSARTAVFLTVFSGLTIALAVGVFCELIMAFGSQRVVLRAFDQFIVLFVALCFGLAFGLNFGAEAGGSACFNHFLLRLWLIRNGSIPWTYVSFLDFAAERVLLRKVGGGYVFLHRMLMDYFAARYVESASQASTTARPWSVE